MNTTTAKPTPGPWRVTGQYIEAASTMYGTQIIATFGNSRGDSNRHANLSLAAEAGTVYHETGLTPRQLAGKLIQANRQRAELLAALEYYGGSPIAVAEGRYPERDRGEIARAAIARAKAVPK